ncbi:hypothetical protein DPMN_150324 [Dreissena polymorpha]|uniref:Uncharacterized protein n=1 Tax=Dreissena polymorpha TaxID=45954 RepID=A0A9D4FG85_DREPO|nr:hypothetical protein DPMN_150324 [Dreissena polymorpha]
MLKDVTDSKRVNTRISDERKQKGEEQDVEVNAMILSAQFWPAFREEKVQLPDCKKLNTCPDDDNCLGLSFV